MDDQTSFLVMFPRIILCTCKFDWIHLEYDGFCCCCCYCYCFSCAVLSSLRLEAHLQTKRTQIRLETTQVEFNSGRVNNSFWFSNRWHRSKYNVHDSLVQSGRSLVQSGLYALGKKPNTLKLPWEHFRCWSDLRWPFHVLSRKIVQRFVFLRLPPPIATGGVMTLAFRYGVLSSSALLIFREDGHFCRLLCTL